MRDRPVSLVKWPTRRWRGKTLPMLMAVLAIVTGCSSPIEVQYRKTTAPPSTSQPGAVLDAQPFADVDPAIAGTRATATRVVYRSTSGVDDSPTEVSGAVFTPVGKPPVGGWPVIAIAHDTVGINPECGPSLSPTLLDSVGMVANYLKVGWAVTVTDYQGLGHPGWAHPYLEPKTAAFNIIDSVKALRAVSPQVATKWAVVGVGQGGAAAWAANEQAATYGKDLNLVGAVALAPLADITAMARQAADRTLTRDQLGAYIWTLMGIADTRPDFPLDEYRRGAVVDHWDQLRACRGGASDERARILNSLAPEDLTPADEGATERLTEIFHSMALPQQRGAGPLLVMYGGKDDFIDAEWTRAAIARSCALGTKIAVAYQPDSGHEDLRTDEFVGWLIARMDGLPPPDNC